MNTLLILLWSSLALAAPFVNHTTPSPQGRIRCANDVTAEAVQVAAKKFEAIRVPSALFLAADTSGPAEIKIYWHLVSANTTKQGGWLSPWQIDSQIDVLNRDYASAGIRWTVAKTSRMVNEDWFERAGPGSSQQVAMKKHFHTGDAASLNVYSVGFVSGQGKGILGYSSFPWDYSANPSDDGVVILHSSVPGGAETGYNLGRTLTHEVGHWLGLYHTFQGGCDGDGDMVDDTPAEASPAAGCPVGRNSCSAQGLDPISNFMDYSYDSCMNAFSKGQIERLKAQIRTFRKVVI